MNCHKDNNATPARLAPHGAGFVKAQSFTAVDVVMVKALLYIVKTKLVICIYYKMNLGHIWAKGKCSGLRANLAVLIQIFGFGFCL